MIISYKHRFIFVHCRKAAGSSVTAYLNRHLGPDDIQIGIWKGSLHAGGQTTRRVVRECFKPAGIRAIARRLGQSIRTRRRPTAGQLLNAANRAHWARWFPAKPMHPTAEEIAATFPEEWEQFFKFCFVRNPWDRTVSEFTWARAAEKGVSFEEFVERIADPDRPDPEKVRPVPVNTWPMYTLGGEVAVDFVGRFESLQNDMRAICRRIGIPFEPECFPTLKRGPGWDYTSFYTDHETEMIRRTHEPEINQFNYRFFE